MCLEQGKEENGSGKHVSFSRISRQPGVLEKHIPKHICQNEFRVLTHLCWDASTAALSLPAAVTGIGVPELAKESPLLPGDRGFKRDLPGPTTVCHTSSLNREVSCTV